MSETSCSDSVSPQQNDREEGEITAESTECEITAELTEGEIRNENERENVDI